MQSYQEMTKEELLAEKKITRGRVQEIPAAWIKT